VSTKISNYDDRLEIVREISRFTVRQNDDSTEDFFDSALRLIGKTLNCNACGILDINEAGGFDLINCYDKRRKTYINNIVGNTWGHASDTILRQQTNHIDMTTTENIYYVPMKNLQPTSVLMFSFKDKLDTKGIELLESISSLLASAVEKISLRQQLKRQYLSTVKSLVVAMEAKDVYTQGHSQRVASYSKMIGERLKLKSEEIDELEITGLVHDIGKIGISDILLTKPEKLTDIEFDTLKQHPEIGTKILEPLGVSDNVMMGTLLHHKRYDLKGYPNDLTIESLPLVPAIIGVADAFDAMTSERTYKKTISKCAALKELKRHKGTQFDPKIVDVMEELLKSDNI
jgi:response regulator RpfG family c-di-GMP phosphodiesterase